MLTRAMRACTKNVFGPHPPSKTIFRAPTPLARSALTRVRPNPTLARVFLSPGRKLFLIWGPYRRARPRARQFHTELTVSRRSTAVTKKVSHFA
jgi:hypothetical protein